MKIFISQSGPRSRQLALALSAFIRMVLQDTEPWVYQRGIDKGTRSLPAITDTLEKTSAGIICLTPENSNEPWILFEAGALPRRSGDRVWTILPDVEDSQVEPPLGQFQHAKADKDELLKAVPSINAATPRPQPQLDIEKLFTNMWPTERAGD
jgi:hypothetical protein